MTKLYPSSAEFNNLNPQVVRQIGLPGDYAQGMRTVPIVTEGADFARGQRTLTAFNKEGPDYVRGERTLIPTLEGPDYARGLRGTE